MNPFSVISSANLICLDLNGEKIAGTRVPSQINRIALLSSTPERAAVVYSGYGLNAIKQAEINLEEKTAETFTFVDGLSDSVSAIAPVFDKELHERLLDNERR